MQYLDSIGSSVPDRTSPGTVSGTVPDRFSVIVPVFNCKQELRLCLDSLLAAVEKCGNAEVIAVDNGSTDGSYEILTTEYPGVRVLRYPDLTIAALRNRGAEAASGEYLSFIDADCVVPADYFDEARATLRDSDAAATGSMCGVPESSTWVERGWYALHSHSRNGLVKYLNSGNFVIRQQVFTAVGGFNEELTTGEDTELGQSLRSNGFGIYENHRVRAIHLRNSKTLGQFFRRCTWHGQGLLIPSSASWLNKSLLMTCGHLALTTVGLVQLSVAHNSLAVRVACLVLALSFVPAVTWLFRSMTNRRLSSPLTGIVLYQFYYAAKLYALLSFATRKRRRTYHK
jgi:glycosyltransferase involved in cell wall biosynthesis